MSGLQNDIECGVRCVFALTAVAPLGAGTAEVLIALNERDYANALLQACGSALTSLIVIGAYILLDLIWRKAR